MCPIIAERQYMSWPATPKVAVSLDTARYPVMAHQKITFNYVSKNVVFKTLPGAGLKEAVECGCVQRY